MGIRPLRETGIGEDQFVVIARDALEEGSLLTNPRKVEYEDVMAILEEVY